MRLLLSLLIVLVVFFAGCDFERRETSPLSSPLSSPLELRTQNCFPTDAFHGALMGKLFLTNHQPAVGSMLYLGEYVGLETSNPLVVLDPGKHPYTRTDEKGAFCFPEVLPGKYGLVVWNAAESVLLPDPNTGYSLILEIKPGEMTDVGILYSPIP